MPPRSDAPTFPQRALVPLANDVREEVEIAGMIALSRVRGACRRLA